MFASMAVPQNTTGTQTTEGETKHATSIATKDLASRKTAKEIHTEHRLTVLLLLDRFRHCCQFPDRSPLPLLEEGPTLGPS